MLKVGSGHYGVECVKHGWNCANHFTSEFVPVTPIELCMCNLPNFTFKFEVSSSTAQTASLGKGYRSHCLLGSVHVVLFICTIKLNVSPNRHINKTNKSPPLDPIPLCVFVFLTPRSLSVLP